MGKGVEGCPGPSPSHQPVLVPCRAPAVRPPRCVSLGPPPGPPAAPRPVQGDKAKDKAEVEVMKEEMKEEKKEEEKPPQAPTTAAHTHSLPEGLKVERDARYVCRGKKNKNKKKKKEEGGK